jgi:hypothetical protein
MPYHFLHECERAREWRGYLILEAIAQRRCIEPLSDPESEREKEAGFVDDTGDRSWSGMSIPGFFGSKGR